MRPPRNIDSGLIRVGGKLSFFLSDNVKSPNRQTTHTTQSKPTCCYLMAVHARDVTCCVRWDRPPPLGPPEKHF